MTSTNLLDLLKGYPYLNRVKVGQILEKTGENLNYWVKKLRFEKILLPLKNGLYVSSPFLLTLEGRPGEKEIYREYLANILRYPSYVSLEYAASKYGLIPEGVFAVTSVTLKTPRAYQTALGSFTYRNISEKLFFGYDYVKFVGKPVAIARPGKALFDLLYFKKFPPMESLRINYGALSQAEKDYFDKLMKKYDHR